MIEGFKGKESIFVQGGPAQSALYSEKGGVKLTAVLAMLEPGAVVGEGFCKAALSRFDHNGDYACHSPHNRQKRDDAGSPPVTRVFRPFHRLRAVDGA